ncbi:di-trans,poly-cis-decaprenylcistransferase [Candidatus Micrarchaeota archaeon]|nr:di-trans,poly-cis-decaprenylcistransferase [Candidatus Micrarchaeota archaeon]
MEGHAIGIEKIKEVVGWCRDAGVRELSLWGFSTENFDRDPAEVIGLMKLFETKLSELLSSEELKKHEVRVRFFGDLERIPPPVRAYLKKVEDATKSNGEYNLNILLSYGGRPELISACNKILDAAKRGEVKKIDESNFQTFLWTSELSEPDLVVRTSGEQRTSGVLPWQAAYAELYFCEKLWPDFSKEDFEKILKEFDRRERRFGK